MNGSSNKKTKKVGTANERTNSDVT